MHLRNRWTSSHSQMAIPLSTDVKTHLRKLDWRLDLAAWLAGLARAFRAGGTACDRPRGTRAPGGVPDGRSRGIDDHGSIGPMPISRTRFDGRDTISQKKS